MKRLSKILIVFCLFAVGGCLSGTGQTGSPSAPASSFFAPSAGEAGASPYAASGPSSGPGGSEEGPSDAPAPVAEAGSAGTYSDTPITVVGNTVGSTPKRPPTCNVAYALCFQNVTVSITGEEADTGRQAVAVTGNLIRGDTLEPLPGYLIGIYDPRDPPKRVGSAETSSPDGSFNASLLAASGLTVQFQVVECRAIVQMDLVIPDPSTKTKVVGDVCGEPPPVRIMRPPAEEFRRSFMNLP